MHKYDDNFLPNDAHGRRRIAETELGGNGWGIGSGKTILPHGPIIKEQTQKWILAYVCGRVCVNGGLVVQINTRHVTARSMSVVVITSSGNSPAFWRG